MTSLQEAVKEALGYLDWIHSVAADWPDVDENYEKVAAAARLVADGEVIPKADMREIQWCVVHDDIKMAPSYLGCRSGMQYKWPAASKPCSIVPALLWTKTP